MKVALVVGHNPKRQGADAVRPLSISEYRFWDALLDKASVPGVQLRKFLRSANLPYYDQIEQCYAEVDAWGADESIEFHFNAGGGTGTETLSSGTRGSLAMCRKLQEAMVGALCLPNRGVKIRRKYKGRGWPSLWCGRAPAALVEPFFGDSAGDVGRVVELGAENLLRAILSIYEKG
jgi:N-acetylmuramoyl-L-alanine amidase